MMLYNGSWWESDQIGDDLESWVHAPARSQGRILDFIKKKRDGFKRFSFIKLILFIGEIILVMEVFGWI